MISNGQPLSADLQSVVDKHEKQKANRRNLMRKKRCKEKSDISPPPNAPPSLSQTVVQAGSLTVVSQLLTLEKSIGTDPPQAYFDKSIGPAYSATPCSGEASPPEIIDLTCDEASPPEVNFLICFFLNLLNTFLEAKQVEITACCCESTGCASPERDCKT